MYKEKTLGPLLKKRGCAVLPCAKFQLGVGTSMRSTAPRAARLRHIVACDILSHWLRHIVTPASLYHI